MSDRNLTAAVDNVARQNTFHPIRDYLSSVVWDGVPRIETLFIDFLGCTDTPYHRQTARLMMIAAATRAFEPGHKFDFVPILEGPQGIRKSTFIRVLAKDWFGELHIDSNNENRMIESMLGRWILEIPELSGFNKADNNTLKSLVSRAVDQSRLAYEKRTQEYPRQCILIGSTNDRDYLRDETGNRRYWPIRGLCHDDPSAPAVAIDIDRLQTIVDQLWGEAYATYRAMRQAQPQFDLPLHLTGDQALAEAFQLQENRRSESPEELLAADIRAKLDTPEETDFDGVPTPRTRICVKELWVDLLGKPAKDLESQLTTRLVGRALRMAGWTLAKSTMRHPKYGIQKFYTREQK